jgi:uncharacterized protein (PEP-CTERM system associated)
LAVPVVVMAALLAPAAHGADWTFVPTVELRQTYTDNLTLATDELARGQFVTELTPGFLLNAKGRRLDLRARYQLSYFAFSDNDLAGTNSSQQMFSGDARATLIDEMLFLDAAGSIGNQAISPFGPQVNSNNYASANRAKVKTYRISPYLKHNFGDRVRTELRYTHDSVDSGNVGLRTSESDTMSLRVSNNRAGRRFGWDATHSRQRLDDNLSESNTEQSNLSLRYSLTSRFALTGSAGHDSYDYQSLGGATEGQSWSAGLEWTPSSRTSFKASAGKRFFGDSYTLTALHRSRHSVWSINYNDAVTTSRAQFLLPATINTAAMLDDLFAANIADPVARARAVQEYIASNALPDSLATNINYFSNRYLLQKQFQASAAFRSARSTLVLSVFNTRREPLSVQEAGGPFEPGAIFNEPTEQRGASASASYSISARSMLSLSASSTKTDSSTTGQAGDQRAVRLALTRQFQSRLKGALELRRVNGTLASGTGTYRETALSASLSLQL